MTSLRGVVGFLLVVFLLGGALGTGRILRAGDEWLPVPPEDLALKDSPENPGAAAIILYHESSINAEDSSVSDYLRIKIFTEQGKEQGDVELPYSKGESEIRDIRARTIRPDGSIVNFTGKLFDKLIVKAGGSKVLAKVFSLPDVRPGGIIE